MVQAARDAYGLEVVVLRMLDSELPRPHGGGVTYLAETAPPIARAPPPPRPSQPFDVTLDDQPLRLRWALPGGPDRDLAWAEDVLAGRRIERDGPGGADPQLEPVQHLAPAARRRPDSAWLKVVPPFFAHEGDMLRRLQADPVPRLLGHDGPRVLLADIEGEDQYDAAAPGARAWSRLLVELQAAWIGRDDELLAMRLPDWRGPGADGAHRGRRGAALARSWTRRGRATLDGLRRGAPGAVRGDRRRAGSRTRSSTATTTRATCAGTPAG